MRRLLASGAVILVCLVGVSVPPAVGADPAGCRVRNVTQGTAGSSFEAMVGAAVDGDRLTVRGRCAAGLTIRDDLAIRGVGDPRPLLLGHRRQRVLRVTQGASVGLRHLAIAGGRLGMSDGGGIHNSGTLILADVVVRGNGAEDGGGIYNARGGTMTLADSVVRDNDAIWGSGIWNAGRLTVIRSVVRDNDDGGGLYNHRDDRGEGTLVLSDSVVRGNTAHLGGGILNEGTATVVDSRVRANRAGWGGGIWSSGHLRLARSSIVGNAADASPGGGGLVTIYGSATLVASEVSDNTADWSGGGIWNAATLVLRASTVSGNLADDEGGGIWNNQDHGEWQVGSVTLDADSSVMGNTPDDCVGTPAC